MNNLLTIFKGLVISILVGIAGSQSVHARPIQIPLGIAYGVEPNVMILLDNSGSMSANTLDDGNGNTVTRLQVAKNALTQVLNETDNVRFCMSRFQPASFSPTDSPGGFMDNTMQCTGVRSEIDNLVTTINALADPPPATSTPLSESYYDVTRYFRGLSPYFGRFQNASGNSTTFDSPVQYRCQANSVIVVTDGESQLDWDRQSPAANPIDLSFEDAGGKSLPNWDNIPPNGTHHNRDANNQFPQFSDGLCGTDVTTDGANCGNSTSVFQTSRTIFLDDLALFGNETDMRTQEDGQGAELAGGNWDDPLYNDGNQNLKTHTIGFGFDAGTSPIMLSDTANYGQGTAFDATTAGGLVDALKSAILTATGGEGSGAGATQAAFRLSENGSTDIFVTEFNSSRWSGELTKIILSESVDANNDVSFNAEFAWSASDNLNDVQGQNDRTIFTFDNAADSVVDFTFDALPETIRSIFGNTTAPDPGDDSSKSIAERKIEYLRGLRDDEALLDHDGDPTTEPVSEFRVRDTPLGDLVNSRPTFVKNFNFGFPDPDYAEFVEAQETREAMIYVGGNDGMLHAFEDQGDSVTEKFAFIPNTLLDSLPNLANDSFNSNHLFYVDGKMSIVDAKFDSTDSNPGDWATVLGSPLGRGFKGVFLLDITDPDDNIGDLYKWEINETTANIDGDLVYSKMGHMINSPRITRFQIPDGTGGGFHDKWVMIVGNGIHSEDADDLDDEGNPIIGKASVFVIDLDNGELITEIELDNGHEDQDPNDPPAYNNLVDGNGISSIEAVDFDLDTYVDRVYAADLKGQLWRINYDYAQSDSPTDDNEYLADKLTSAFIENGHPAPIFKAEGPVRSDKDDDTPSGPNIIQPITAEMTVSPAPDEFTDRDTVMITFGTGQYFDLPHVLDSENLKVQSMYAMVDTGDWDSGRDAIDRDDDLIEQGITESGLERFFDSEVIDYESGDLGWYLDLPTYGERILLKPTPLFEFIAFSSQIPREADVCALGTDGWNMVAQRDNAVPFSVGGGSPGPAGTKVVNQAIIDPIYVESSTGSISSLGFDMQGSPDNIDVNVLPPNFDTIYRRAAWMRVQ